MSRRLFTALLLFCFYSFGTFGFLNLFGLRVVGQLIAVGLLVVGLFTTPLRVPLTTALAALVFFSVYAIGGFVFGQLWQYPFEAAVGFGAWLVIACSPIGHVKAAAGTIVSATAIMCAAIAFADIAYLAHYSWFFRANWNIYDSTVGSAKISPGFVLDYLTFTSGDGLSIAGHVLPRLKGYSNEPSATVVHYLAPALLGLLLGRRWQPRFILLVNVFAIAALTSHFIIALALLIVFGFYLPRRLATLLMVVGVAGFVVFLLNEQAVVDLQARVSQQALDLAGFDLVARKADSFAVRQQGFAAGLGRVLVSPIGWHGAGEIAGAGLLLIVSGYAGWVGVTALLLKAWRIGQMALQRAKRRLGTAPRFAGGFAVSLVVVALFVSGYGWDRLPGLVMLVLVERLLRADLDAAPMRGSRRGGLVSSPRLPAATTA